ncbi:MAG: putative 2-nitropropane dioxygenase [Blastococcus sp.]|nr:putative 2-nitropropane dioxygenase [Blastococcus sp.]
MIKTSLTRWFDLTTPVIGAPMAGVAGGALARAVSQAGGLGMIGVSGASTAEFVARECALPAADLLPFGVGLMAWVLEDRPDLLEATIAAQPGLVSGSFGDPGPWVGLLHVAGFFREVMEQDSARAKRCHEFLGRLQGTEQGGPATQ